MSVDTFELCGQNYETLRLYEENVAKYFDFVGVRPIPRRLDAQFWKSGKKLSKDAPKRAVQFGFIGVAVGAVLGILLTSVLKTSIISDDVVINTVIFTVVGAVLGVACALALDAARRLQITSALAREERALEATLRRLPPKYRNAFCAFALYDIYATYGIDNFKQALAACDNHIQSKRDYYPGITYMINLDYREDGDTSEVTDRRADEYKPNMDNPAMPKDIESHASVVPDNADVALDELIGLEDVKSQVRKMRSRMEFYGQDKKDVTGAHMLFLGPAGTGKTTVARIMTRILYDLGYIKRAHMVEVDGDYLKSPTPGMTGERVSAIVDFARGGVLFVDEAYLLADKGASGAEATGVLLKAMEDLRDDIVIILAGYEDAITKLIASNEGFASRVKHKIRFNAYTSDELVEVFESMMKKNYAGYTLEPTAKEALADYFDHAKTHRGFGNARESRNALSVIADIHADRVVSGVEAARSTFTFDDVLGYIDDRKRSFTQDAQSEMAALDLDPAIISYAEAKSYVKEAREGDVWDGHVTNEKRMRDLTLVCAQMNFGRGLLVVVGDSGTGKTDIIECIVRRLYEANVTSTLRFVSVSASLLKGAYVGHTSRRVNALCSFAAGGVLFIDDIANVLVDRNDAFGQEAISTLISNVENDTCKIVITAKQEELNTLFEYMPALQAKCQAAIVLAPYTPKEFCYIMNQQAQNRGFVIADVVWAQVGGQICALSSAIDAVGMLDKWCVRAQLRNSDVIDACDVVEEE